MKTMDLIEGLTILQKYREKQDGANVDAEQDVIYASATDKPVKGPDLVRLLELG